MERLIFRLKTLTSALVRLKEVLDLFEKTNEENNFYSILRDSVIQRFEFSVDIFWKTLKDFLEEHHKISAASPRTVIRECFSQQLINSNELQVLEDMIDARNDTSHKYDEDMSNGIVQDICQYYNIMNSIKERLFNIYAK